MTPADVGELRRLAEQLRIEVSASMADDVVRAADEIERLNKWADGMTDAALKERHTGEEYQRELRAEIERLTARVAELTRERNHFQRLYNREWEANTKAGDAPRGGSL